MTAATAEQDVCPTCGDVELSLDDVVVAACDVLVLRALELIGKRIVRSERSRWRRLGDHPMIVAHLLWPADAATVDRALDGAFDDWLPSILGDHGHTASAGAVAAVLDRYVRDLVAEQQGHRIEELRLRLGPVL